MKILNILICFLLIGSINGQIVITNVECVSPSPPTFNGSLKVTVNTSIDNLTYLMGMGIDDCESQVQAGQLGLTADTENTTFIYFTGFPGGGCQTDFTGSLTLLFANTDNTTINLIDGVITPSEDIIPSSMLFGVCNSHIKDLISEAIYDNTLEVDDCVHWNGDCGINGTIWRNGVLMSHNVSIQCIPSDVKLAIDFEVITEEFMTCNDDIVWCDYVFEKDYNLMPIPDVKEFVAKNKRLPSMPSAEDILNIGGYILPDLIIVQHEKIEELFIHAVSLNARLNKIDKRKIESSGFKENVKYKGKSSASNAINTNSSFFLNMPPPNSPCAADCSELIDEHPDALQEFVLSQLSNSSCKKWTGPCFPANFNPIQRLGPVGIGTNDIPSGFKLAVNGTAMFEELYILLCDEYSWCDYVFEEDYIMPNFTELEQFLKTNKRLPGIPSASKIKNDGGIMLKQITVLQQEKIEELYLYLFDISNRIKLLKNK